ncbi:hypothetical protein K7432_008774 [Basidiobolus ranarum]|uniref:Uncharacterized protein n=1 Tax=Basidiobolus ranarum TaxID=34480 RepID=A0ABR2VY65_9FUNG
MGLAQPIPSNEIHSPIAKYSPKLEQGESWQEQLEQVEYTPGDEYEEDQFEDYANDYSFLLPDAPRPQDANSRA